MLTHEILMNLPTAAELVDTATATVAAAAALEAAEIKVSRIKELVLRDLATVEEYRAAKAELDALAA